MNLRPVWLLTALMILAPLSGCLSFSNDSGGSGDGSMDWIDPVTEIEDDNHSHNDLLAHRLATPNAKLIDYHNLNCDGNVKPPATWTTWQVGLVLMNSKMWDRPPEIARR